MKWPNSMSYEYQPDGGTHVYKSSGEGWYIKSNNLDEVRSYVTALLVSACDKENVLGYLGQYGTAYPSMTFTHDQLRQIHGAAAKNGYLKYHLQVDLAAKLGVSRQAIHDRVKRGTLRSVTVDGHPVVLDDDLSKDERAKVAA